jgi:hypothetical protein
MYRPRSEVVHVGLDILGDSGLICMSDICIDVLEASARIPISFAWSLEDSFEVERQSVPGHELPTLSRRISQGLRHPLGATLGGERIDDT